MRARKSTIQRKTALLRAGLAAGLLAAVLLPGAVPAAELDGLSRRLADASPAAFGALAGDAELARQLSQALADLDPERRALVEARLAETPGWASAPDALLATLTGEQRAALRRAAERELEAGRRRAELQRVFAVLSLLDEGDLEPLGIDRDRMRALSRALSDPSARVTGQAPGLEALTRQIVDPLPEDLRSRLGVIGGDEERVAAYRSGLTRTLLAVGEGRPQAAALLGEIEGLDGTSLALLETQLPAARIAELEQVQPLLRHRQVIDVLEQAHFASTVEEERRALRGGEASATRVTQLEAFRDAFSAELLATGQPALAEEIDAALPADLLEWEAAADSTSLPAIASAAGAIAIEIGPGDGTRPSPRGCGLTDIGCWVNSVRDKVESGFGALFGAVRGALDVINGWLIQTRDKVVSAAQNLPQQAFDLLKQGYEALVQPVVEQFSPDRLASTLGLEEEFWNDLPQAPEIPCPAIGEQIPFFGTVGDGDAAQKYENYLWIFDQLLDIIPDTEVSLSAKIPAKIAYGGVQYLGVCLEQAAAAVEGEQTDAYRAGVGQALDENLGGLDAANGALVALQSELGDLSRQVDAGLAATLELVTVREIEQDLAARGPLPLASFFLPAAVGGQLERAREIVGRAIADNAAAGLDTGQASERLALADEQITAGEYRTGYALLRLAYQDAVAGVGTEVSPL